VTVGRFLAGVAALVRGAADGKYLLLQRSAAKDFGSGAWECVTGRVDQGEGFTAAVRREVREELGVEVRVDFIVGTMHFYRGPATPANELVGVQYCCSLADPSSIRISGEHSVCRWVTATEAQVLLPAGHWLRRAIRRAETIRGLSPSGLLEYYCVEGFDV
jgi:8-oxo-dGTP diphosphatase